MAILFVSLLCSWPDETLKLGDGQTWYAENTTKQQSLEGILDYQAGSGRIGLQPGYSPFRVVRKDTESGKVQQFAVHAPGFESVLALNVGQRVMVEGKIIVKGEGEKKVEELWIGTMKPLGAAPLNVFTELKPIARSNKFRPSAVRPKDDAACALMRDGKEAARIIGFPPTEPDGDRKATQYLAQEVFAIKNIDWKSQMVIYVGNVYQGVRVRNIKIEITRIEVHEKGATVFWKTEAGDPRRPDYSSDTVLVPRVDGEVTFKQEDVKKPAEEKGEKPVEKLVPVIPGAPVK